MFALSRPKPPGELLIRSCSRGVGRLFNDKGVGPPPDYPKSSWKVFGFKIMLVLGRLGLNFCKPMRLNKLYLPIRVPDLDIEKKAKMTTKTDFLFLSSWGSDSRQKVRPPYL